ncbi:putative glucuronosyltransferase [Lupinus albus]|uniref:Hexosyltransferase n=1 Tax=Lupinus albus TaxID=3870 RepID=A0A6A4QSU6_LUPAL|nr:putative glucuronosyltransferase [Lupinus albus]
MIHVLIALNYLLGKELWRPKSEKFAYVSILHSSEAYVCGAIALAQSILPLEYKNHSNPDLLLLVDNSIGSESIRGLKAAGWKIKHIELISKPFSKNGSHNNEWNYSKVLIWQLTMYDKIIFLDADVLILDNIEELFTYPQLSAASYEQKIFNPGFMLIEPSQCMFENMVQKLNKVQSSYNGGDQGFLNDVFTWWHRLLWEMNYLKHFERQRNMSEKHEVPEDVYTIHYLGLKPWMCYRDYDCNWDIEDHHVFASDLAHQRWWEVYDSMPKKLQSYCGLRKEMDERIRHSRENARNSNLSDGHWKIEIMDPRRKSLIV